MSAASSAPAVAASGPSPGLRKFVFWSGVIMLCAWVIVPIYFIALGAFGGRAGVFRWPKSVLPWDSSLAAVQAFLNVEGVWGAALNGAIVAALTMLFSLLLGAPAGYALARFHFAGANVFRLLVVMTRAFPLAILALPLTVSFIRVGLYDTQIGVALVHTALALPFAALVSASLFMAIPKELEEAAWVFGCSKFKAFMKVVLPLALPGLAAAAIFAFVISWNEVFAASVLTVKNRTLTAYLLTVLAESPLHYRFTGGFLLILPSILFIFAVRKYLFAMWGIANR